MRSLGQNLSTCKASTSARVRPVFQVHRRPSVRTCAQAVEVAASPDVDTFYSILGVEPSSDIATIKRAYYDLVKECHPDRSTDDDSSNFCVLLNEIYEVLGDPVRRAVYDETIGVTIGEINPFVDQSQTADQVFVDEFACIGCRNCASTCPNTFKIEEDWGRARAYSQGVDKEDDLQDAIDTCPVSCIHWVSGTQRRLLEEAMGKMNRVPVWAMMSGAGSNANVFAEASGIWERKMADLRMEADIAAADAFWSSVPWTGPGSDFRTSGSNGSSAHQEAGRGVVSRVEALAARAAVAARRWKQAQAEQRVKDTQRVLR